MSVLRPVIGFCSHSTRAGPKDGGQRGPHSLPWQFSKVFPRRSKKLPTFCYTNMRRPRRRLVNCGLIFMPGAMKTEIVHES